MNKPINEKEDVKDQDIKDQDKPLNFKPFQSCGCSELATWHPGQVEHKMKCEKFWSLNPGRTKEELLRFEGFLK